MYVVCRRAIIQRSTKVGIEDRYPSVCAKTKTKRKKIRFRPAYQTYSTAGSCRLSGDGYVVIRFDNGTVIEQRKIGEIKFFKNNPSGKRNPRLGDSQASRRPPPPSAVHSCTLFILSGRVGCDLMQNLGYCDSLIFLLFFADHHQHNHHTINYFGPPCGKRYVAQLQDNP